MGKELAAGIRLQDGSEYLDLYCCHPPGPVNRMDHGHFPNPEGRRHQSGGFTEI